MKFSDINKMIIQQMKKALRILEDAKFIGTPKKNNVISYTINSKFGVTMVDVYYIIINNKDLKIVKIVDSISGQEEIWREGTIYQIMNDIIGWYYIYSEETFENTCILVKFKDHSIRIDKELYNSYMYISNKVIAQIILKHYYKLYNTK